LYSRRLIDSLLVFWESTSFHFLSEYKELISVLLFASIIYWCFCLYSSYGFYFRWSYWLAPWLFMGTVNSLMFNGQKPFEE
jgi:hypothetical protein